MEGRLTTDPKTSEHAETRHQVWVDQKLDQPAGDAIASKYSSDFTCLQAKAAVEIERQLGRGVSVCNFGIVEKHRDVLIVGYGMEGQESV